MVWTCFCRYDFYSLSLAQRPSYLLYLCLDLSIDDLSPILRGKQSMVSAIPRHVCLTILVHSYYSYLFWLWLPGLCSLLSYTFGLIAISFPVPPLEAGGIMQKNRDSPQRLSLLRLIRPSSPAAGSACGSFHTVPNLSAPSANSRCKNAKDNAIYPQRHRHSLSIENRTDGQGQSWTCGRRFSPSLSGRFRI